MKNMGLYEKVPLQECFDVTGEPPASTRWVDTNKDATGVTNQARSRKVAQNIKKSGALRPELYSPTPPLEAVKILLQKFVDSNILEGKEYNLTHTKVTNYCNPMHNLNTNYHIQKYNLTHNDFGGT